ncbi:MAG: hypothetical protein FMNOHCHN_00299 [Ignavibacteriaceae bacterium]|nr:hypothetical protein [Ignavibacteriaceae bacterium]
MNSVRCSARHFRYGLILILLFVSFLNGCAGVFKTEDTNNLTKEERIDREIARMINSADYEFYNLKMLQNPEEWKGKLVAVSGTISTNSIYDLQGMNKTVFFVSGTNSGYMTRVLIFVDSPLPTEAHVSEQRQIISNGSQIRVFGTLIDLKELTSEDGVVRKYPMIRTSLIYLADDRQFTNILWQSKALGVVW